MGRNYKLVNRATKSIVNLQSNGLGGSVVIQSNAGLNAWTGVMVANTFKTVLSVTGAGRISFMAVKRLDATSRTLGLRLTIDGVVVFSATDGAVASTSSGICAVGNYADKATDGGNVYFNSSFSLEVSSSLSETDKVAVVYSYEVF